MIIGTHNLEQQVLVVAEVGNNHEGSYALAEEMVGLAAECGAHAVKFQTFQSELYVRQQETARFDRLKSFELSYSQFERLAKIAAQSGIMFLSTPFDLESAKFLEGLVPAYKIASGDNDFFPLLTQVAGTGKPVLLSTGLSDLETVRRAANCLSAVWQRLGLDEGLEQRLALLHCVTSYPTPPAQANLRAITSLQSEFGLTVGYSDHTLGIEAAVLSVALGARIVEKHFTLSHDQSDFPDHKISADPSELRHIVQRVRQVQELLGTGDKTGLPEAEKPAREVARRSIMASRDLPVGAVLEREDLIWLRPRVGLAPGQEHLLLGRKLRQPVARGEALVQDMLTPEGS